MLWERAGCGCRREHTQQGQHFWGQLSLFWLLGISTAPHSRNEARKWAWAVRGNKTTQEPQNLLLISWEVWKNEQHLRTDLHWEKFFSRAGKLFYVKVSPRCVAQDPGHPSGLPDPGTRAGDLFFSLFLSLFLHFCGKDPSKVASCTCLNPWRRGENGSVVDPLHGPSPQVVPLSPRVGLSLSAASEIPWLVR